MRGVGDPVELFAPSLFAHSFSFFVIITGTASTTVPYARRYAYDDMSIPDPPYYKYVPFYMYFR